MVVQPSAISYDRPEHQLDIIAENQGRFLRASEVPYGTLEEQTLANALAAQKPAIGNESGIDIRNTYQEQALLENR